MLSYIQTTTPVIGVQWPSSTVLGEALVGNVCQPCTLAQNMVSSDLRRNASLSHVDHARAKRMIVQSPNHVDPPAQLGPALCGMLGALLLPPLVLGGMLWLTLRIVRFSLLAILSAIDLFASDWYPLIVLLIISATLVLAEIGAFWGFLGGTLLANWLQRTPPHQLFSRSND